MLEYLVEYEILLKSTGLKIHKFKSGMCFCLSKLKRTRTINFTYKAQNFCCLVSKASLCPL